jgi:serralysin
MAAPRQNVINGTAKTDTLIGSNTLDDAIYAGGGNDWVYGMNGRDWLFGQAGDDHLFGGAHNDVLDGGAGADELDGGSGIDAATYASATSAVYVNLYTGHGYWGDAQGDTFVSIENVTGSNHDDLIYGTDEANVLDGGAGADTILGMGGNDILIASGGGDQLHGGADNDTFRLTDSLSGYRFYGDGGIDTIDLSQLDSGRYVELGGSTYDPGAISIPGVATSNFLYSVENAIGTAYADIIIGSNDANEIHGGGGNDIIVGGSGGDHIYGDGGIDTFRAATGQSMTISLATGTTSDGDFLYGIENVEGSYDGDVIEGDDNDNALSGLTGNDVIAGGGGNDILTGGPDFDTFVFDHHDYGEADVITDFTVASDRIDLHETEIESWLDLNFGFDGDYMEQVGTDVVIHTSDEDTVTLLNVQLSTLSPDNFIF